MVVGQDRELEAGRFEDLLRLHDMRHRLRQLVAFGTDSQADFHSPTVTNSFLRADHAHSGEAQRLWCGLHHQLQM